MTAGTNPTCEATVAATVRALEQNRTWLLKLDRNGLYVRSNVERIHDVVWWVVHYLAASPTTKLRDWRRRGRVPRARQAAIDDPSKAARSPDGLKAIRDLISLAISELLACESWQKLVDTQWLPGVVAKQECTETQRAALAKANAASAANRAKARQRDEERFQEAVDRHLGKDTGPSTGNQKTPHISREKHGVFSDQRPSRDSIRVASTPLTPIRART
jgi:hypothetical protein